MILVEPKVELLKVSKTYEEMISDIARAARICYASEGGKRSDEEFLWSLYKRHHGRPFEFGTLYICNNVWRNDEEASIIRKRNDEEASIIRNIIKSPWTRIAYSESRMYLTTNMRVLKDVVFKFRGENDESFQYVLDFAKKSFQWTPYHIERYTFHWTVSRVTADSFRTHIMISSLMQSTRYCNYSLGKFGGQLQICRPCWMEHSAEWLNNAFADQPTTLESIYLSSYRVAEQYYNSAIANEHPAQLARGVLPLDVKTEFIQCAYPEDWENFLNQRAKDSTGPAHPDAHFITTQALELFEHRERCDIE